MASLTLALAPSYSMAQPEEPEFDTPQLVVIDNEGQLDDAVAIEEDGFADESASQPTAATPADTETPEEAPILSATGTTVDDENETLTDQAYDEYDLANATVTVTDTVYMDYPQITVTLNGKELWDGIDYQYTFKNEKKVGTATVYITGDGDYYGETSATFKVLPKQIADEEMTLIDDEIYTGSPIKPKMVPYWIYYDYPNPKAGVDYTLSFKNNVNVGTATVILTGKGNYTGTAKMTFKIVKASILLADIAEIPTQKWTGKAVKPKPVLKYEGRTLKEGTDYTLYYTSNVKAGAQAQIHIVGKGNFEEDAWVSFRIGDKPGTWKKSAGKWWYRYSDGSYPKSRFASIDGKWYYFDGSGWMVTGWRKIGGLWYYFKSSGAMATGWQKLGGVWYYFYPEDGYMATGWVRINYTWYYFTSGGSMVTGWRSIGGNWYYFRSSGSMVSSTWVGNYYLGSSGAMLRNTITPDGYWVGSDGKWRSSGGSGGSGGSSDSGSSGSYDTVYWVSGGSVWHSTPNCVSLSRSTSIHSGSIAESGKSRGCKNCT